MAMPVRTRKPADEEEQDHDVAWCPFGHTKLAHRKVSDAEEHAKHAHGRPGSSI